MDEYTRRSGQRIAAVFRNASDNSLGTSTQLKQGVGTLSRPEMVRSKEVTVRCLACDKQYTLTQTFRGSISSDGHFDGWNEDPLSGLCPECGSWKKEKI
jgi:hypothetical protein